MWWILVGCESETEREEREWTEQFGPIATRYSATAGDPEIAPELVRGRKVLADTSRPYHTPEAWEATDAAQVGLVVVDSVLHDATPSATYEGGTKGYGGQVTMTAWAHPEGKRVASMSFRCEAPRSNLEYVNGRTGASTLKLDARCYPSRESRLRFGGELVDAIAPSGANTDAAGARALLALGEAHAALADAPPARGAPDVAGRKALLLVASSVTPEWRVWQKDSHVPAAALATAPGEVGLVVLWNTTFEERPSRRYECGVQGFAGEARVTAVAHPEGTVVASAPVPCVLPPEEDVAILADLLRERRCETEPLAVKAFVAGLVGG